MATTTTSPSPPPDMATTTAFSSSAAAPPPPPLPTTARRPRRRCAREVSSRYLSTPLPSSPRLSTSSSPTPSPRAHHRPPTPFANENYPPHPPPTASRKRAVQKLFDEISNPRVPIPAPAAKNAATPKLPRSSSAPTARKGYPRPPTPARASSCPYAPEEASTTSSSSTSSDTSSIITDVSDADGVAAAAPCESPPLLGPASCRGRASSELRASMPESAGPGRASNPLCYRSLNSALSGCQAAAAVRPPQPPGVKAVEAKKAAVGGGRKVAGRQEDVHRLRLLHNCYIQYRFLNTRTAAATKAKTVTAEKSIYGLSERIASLRESIAEKKVELGQIQTVQRLCSIVDAQVPYLDQWSALKGDHSICLTGATTALRDASLRLPILGNIKTNIGEITEVLNSAVQILEPLSPCVENFLPKVEEIENVTSKLAKVIVSERALIEECGNLLYQAHNMQMREYSLRSQLMLLKQIKAT